MSSSPEIMSGVVSKGVGNISGEIPDSSTRSFMIWGPKDEHGLTDFVDEILKPDKFVNAAELVVIDTNVYLPAREITLPTPLFGVNVQATSPSTWSIPRYEGSEDQKFRHNVPLGTFIYNSLCDIASRHR